jgi:hypothetical protein
VKKLLIVIGVVVLVLFFVKMWQVDNRNANGDSGDFPVETILFHGLR